MSTLTDRDQAPPATTADPAWQRAFAPLAWSNLGAQSAEQIALAAAPILAVMALAAGPAEVGLLSAAQTLPFLLLSIPAGLLADRWPRRRLMLLAEGLRALSLIGLCLAAAFGVVSVAGLAWLGFLGALGTVGFSVAAPALLPALVPRAALGAANGRLELARSVAFAGGPALAGALAGAAGPAAAFALATALSLAAMAALALQREPPRAPAPPRHAALELREGAAFVWRHRLLRPVLLTAVAWNIAWFVLQAAYVPHAMSTLGLDAAGVGFSLATFGGGMVVGALLAQRLVARLRYGSTVLLGPLVSVAAIAVMCATLFVPSGVLAGLSFFLFGAGPIVWTITSTTLRQQVTPGAMLGRVSAMFLTVNTGARPLGAALGAAIGAAFGSGACLWAAAIGFAVQAAVIAASPVRTLARLPEPAPVVGAG